MNQSKSSFSKLLTALIILLLLLGIGGLGGGIVMLLEPSGALLNLTPDFLDPLPISNFILPGLFLTIVMGFFPFIIGDVIKSIAVAATAWVLTPKQAYHKEADRN